MPRRTNRPTLAEPALEGMPAETPKEPTAADLVAAWCAGWAATHDGGQPDPSVLKRVRGICRAVARDRTDLDSWRDAWRAALSAGRRGRYDVIGELAAPTHQTAGGPRQNHYLAIARESAEQSHAARLAEALGSSPAPRELRA